jgi:TonB family protein
LYKKILINKYFGDHIIIANNFNYSLIKTRIKMMSKIKSKKIANVKILVGFVLAASLIAVFACEQKESVKTEGTPAGKTMAIVADGHTLQITGDDAGIEKFKEIISKSKDLELKSDSVSGELTLAQQQDVFFIVDQMPEFPGGQTALQNFIAQTVKYPEEALNKGIQGKVFVSFIVGKTGRVGSMKIARGVDSALDAEALRVVGLLPKWKPGKQGGKLVQVSYTIPINFALD